jgi:hypothetical protein
MLATAYPMIPGMSSNKRRVKSTKVLIIQGPAMTPTTNTASNFGMKDKVISLICVAAWKILTTNPITSEVSSKGAEISIVTHKVCCTKDKTLSEFMAY